VKPFNSFVSAGIHTGHCGAGQAMEFEHVLSVVAPCLIDGHRNSVECYFMGNPFNLPASRIDLQSGTPALRFVPKPIILSSFCRYLSKPAGQHPIVQKGITGICESSQHRQIPSDTRALAPSLILSSRETAHLSIYRLLKIGAYLSGPASP
jgi:hypothetical protein